MNGALARLTLNQAAIPGLSRLEGSFTIAAKPVPVAYSACTCRTGRSDAGMLNGRGLLGDGVIELRRLRQAVDRTGHSGPIEVEIFNEEAWTMPAPATLDLVATRYLTHVAGGGEPS